MVQHFAANSVRFAARENRPAPPCYSNHLALLSQCFLQNACFVPRVLDPQNWTYLVRALTTRNRKSPSTCCMSCLFWHLNASVCLQSRKEARAIEFGFLDQVCAH